jgi:hypothetical protein
MTTIKVNDRIQTGYSYELTEPTGANFDPDFKPDLTPIQMLSMGVFGGKYMTDCQAEFPHSWFAGVRLAVGETKDPGVNFFGVDASQSLEYWRRKGWIHPDDPRGWFQWYCRYFLGRRHEDDRRQIRRWRGMRRHVSQLRRNCIRGDLLCRRRQRQALLHWAYDTRNI